MNSHFFQAFFGPQQSQFQQQIPEYITYNETVFEIANNWEYVRELMIRRAKGDLNINDDMERTWINFLLPRNIVITNYKDSEEFLTTICKRNG